MHVEAGQSACPVYSSAACSATIAAMPYSSLADFLEELAAGQLARVGAEVDPALEIAEITRRVAHARRAGAVVRPRARTVDGRGHESAGHAKRAFAGRWRIESLDEIAARIESLIEKHTPQNWFDRLKMSADEAGAEQVSPQAGQERRRASKSCGWAATSTWRSLPLVKQWPGEVGPAITGGPLMTQERGGRHRRASRSARWWRSTRIAWRSSTTATVRLCPALGQLSQRRREDARGRRAGRRSGQARLRPTSSCRRTVDIYHLAGLLRGKALDVVKCRTHALEVPAEADLVFEGYLDPQSRPMSVRVGRHRHGATIGRPGRRRSCT